MFDLCDKIRIVRELGWYTKQIRDLHNEFGFVMISARQPKIYGGGYNYKLIGSDIWFNDLELDAELANGICLGKPKEFKLK
jgi:hypothetical protein